MNHPHQWYLVAPSVTCSVVNFLCQLDGAKGCSDIWLNVILGVSVRVFLNEMNIQIDILSKADCLLTVGEPHSIR